MTQLSSATRRRACLHALLSHYHPTDYPTFLEGLGNEEADKVQHTSIDQVPASELQSSLLEQIEQIHYSWFEDFLKEEAEDMRTVWASIVPPTFIEPLLPLFKEAPALPLSDSVRLFLLRELYERLHFSSVLPIPLLPPSPLNRLLHLDKRRLVRLIAFLGLYDLAQVMRRAVQPPQREAVVQLLTETQVNFVEKISREQDLFPPSTVPLSKWSESRDGLGRLLQHHGLIRLGSALEKQHSSMVWHLSRRLDVGRGTSLLRHMQQAGDPKLERSACKAVETLLTLFTQRESL